MSYKILHIVGNRPHFIKLTPVYRAFKDYPVDQIIVHTGQHYDATLSDIFIDQFNLPVPNHYLNVGSLSPNKFLSRTIDLLDDVLLLHKPDIVLVYGDTNSTAAGAIAASKKHILLGHVEAGLREFDKSIPEEINKLLTDSVSDLLFAPTKTGYDHLVKIGKENGSYLVGDVGLDLVHQSQIEIDNQNGLLAKFNVEEKNFIFMTCHRAANTDRRSNLKQILNAVSELELPVIFPIHPRTQSCIEKYGMQNLVGQNVTLIDPIGFYETQFLIKKSLLCLTDSGGIIKEAYFHQIPSIIIDQQTEWIEIVQDNWATITGPNTQKIIDAVKNLVVPNHHNMHLGDGTAALKIADICIKKIHTL